jgi:general stress protein YciG
MPRNDEQKSTSNRGFASMDRAKQRQIASKGGQSVPPEKRSFSQDPQLAAQAGRKGGESVPAEGRSFSQNRELAAEAGRKGGQARGVASQQRAAERMSGASAGVQNGGKKEARDQGETFEEDRNIAAEGARKSGLPKTQLAPEDLEEPHDVRGNRDVPQDEFAQRAGRPGIKEHPHGV